MAPGAVRKLWARGVDIFEQSEDYFSQFEGKSPASLIQVKNDTSKGRGQEIEFTTMAGLYNEPHLGEELFEDSSHFEELVLDSNTLKVDWLRHSVRYTERTEEKMGMRGEIVAGLPTEMGKWLGRIKTEQMFMDMLHNTAAASHIIAGGKQTADELFSTDTLDWDEIVAMGVQMEGNGGLPAYVGRRESGGKRNPIFAQCVTASKDALYSLELDPDYKQVLREAGERGNANYIFRGGYTPVRGHVISKYVPVDHDGHGPVGSPINPKAFLGTAVEAGTGVLTLTGGGSPAAAAKTRIHPFKAFPNYAYRFSDGGVLAIGSTPFYVAVVNPASAAVDPRKFGFYKCVTNDGRTIEAVERLGPTDAGAAQLDEVGDVEWDASVHTQVHPSGATIVLCNSKGVPLGYTIMLGRRAARRGYGKWRNRRTTQSHEGGFVRDIYLTSVFGQAPRKDTAGRTPGVLVLTHAIKYAGLPLPDVLPGS